jgi:hypothetical protein
MNKKLGFVSKGDLRGFATTPRGLNPGPSLAEQICRVNKAISRAA